MHSFCLVTFLLRRFPGTWKFKFPKVSFKFVIKHRRITINKRPIKLRPSKNKKFPGWWTFPFHKVTYYIRFTTKGIKIVTLKNNKVVTAKVVKKPKRTPGTKPKKGKKKPTKGTKKPTKGEKKPKTGKKKPTKGTKKPKKGKKKPTKGEKKPKEKKPKKGEKKPTKGKKQPKKGKKKPKKTPKSKLPKKGKQLKCFSHLERINLPHIAPISLNLNES